MKYTWKAYSNDGSFEDDAKIKFDTKKEAYINMRHHALVKVKWNTEWEDLDDNGDSIGYKVHFSMDKIVHESYSGVYTYEIVAIPEVINAYGRRWVVIDSYNPEDMVDWEVCEFPEIGQMWMNNYDGFIVIITPDGTILKSDI